MARRKCKILLMILQIGGTILQSVLEIRKMTGGKRKIVEGMLEMVRTNLDMVGRILQMVRTKLENLRITGREAWAIFGVADISGAPVGSRQLTGGTQTRIDPRPPVHPS